MSKLPNAQDQVWVTVNYTVNIGNYENIKVEAGTSRTINEGEDPVTLRKELTKKLLEEVIESGESVRPIMHRKRRIRIREEQDQE